MGSIEAMLPKMADSFFAQGSTTRSPTQKCLSWTVMQLGSERVLLGPSDRVLLGPSERVWAKTEEKVEAVKRKEIRAAVFINPPGICCCFTNMQLSSSSQ